MLILIDVDHKNYENSFLSFNKNAITKQISNIIYDIVRVINYTSILMNQ